MSHPLHITSTVREVTTPIFCFSCTVAIVDKKYELCPTCIVKEANVAQISNDFTRRRITIIGILIAATALVWFFVAVTRG